MTSMPTEERQKTSLLTEEQQMTLQPKKESLLLAPEQAVEFPSTSFDAKLSQQLQEAKRQLASLSSLSGRRMTIGQQDQRKRFSVAQEVRKLTFQLQARRNFSAMILKFGGGGGGGGSHEFSLVSSLAVEKHMKTFADIGDEVLEESGQKLGAKKKLKDREYHEVEIPLSKGTQKALSLAPEKRTKEELDTCSK
nr:hypothetical protein BaRGS_008924 [Batillaria attramentaria]